MAGVERAEENRKASRRDKSKEQRARRASSAGKLDLRLVNWVALASLNIAFAEEGGAIRVGYTRDGGALAIGCYMGDDYATEYIRPSEDFDLAILEIAEAWLADKGITYHSVYNALSIPSEPRQ